LPQSFPRVITGVTKRYQDYFQSRGGKEKEMRQSNLGRETCYLSLATENIIDSFLLSQGMYNKISEQVSSILNINDIAGRSVGHYSCKKISISCDLIRTVISLVMF
jgi:hypothetical protein